MADVEKICCYDHPNGGGNDNLLPFLANGGMGGQWNNPFIYLVWMMFAGRWFGNGFGGENGAQNIEVQNQLQAIRTQMQDNQNSNLLMDAVKGNDVAISQLASNLNCDFNALNGAICDVRGGIDRLAGEVGITGERVINSINLGNAGLTSALQQCCCATQKEIIKLGADTALENQRQTYELRQGQRDLGVGVTQGFSTLAYENQRQTCDVINAGNANTQRIIDTLNTHWTAEKALKIQDLKFEVSQLKQNQYLANLINGGCGCCYNSGQ